MKQKIGLIILIISFLILGGVTYNLYTYKVATITKVSSLNKQIKTLKSNISNLEKDNENCSTCNVTVNNDKGQLITEELDGMDVLYVTDAVKTDNYYTLKGVIYTAYILTTNEVEDIVKNGTYTIYGDTYTVKAKKDTRSYELYKGDQKDYEIVPIGDYYCLIRGGQIENAWKKTNIHKEIVISSNTPISIGYDYANHYKVADDVFKNYKSLTSAPDTTNPPYYYAFKFNFKDGKCVGLYNVITGLTLENGHPY